MGFIEGLHFPLTKMLAAAPVAPTANPENEETTATFVGLSKKSPVVVSKISPFDVTDDVVGGAVGDAHDDDDVQMELLTKVISDVISPNESSFSSGGTLSSTHVTIMSYTKLKFILSIEV